MLVSLADVAKAAGLHKSTVAKALQDHPKINADTKVRVREIARQIGYRPDPVLSKIATYRWRKPHAEAGTGIAVVWQARNDSEARLSPTLRVAIEAALESTGYRHSWHCIRTLADARLLNRTLYSRGIEGILLGFIQDDAIHKAFDWSRHSVVVFHSGVVATPFHRVAYHVGSSVREALHRARSAGFRRPGIVVFDEHCQLDDVLRVGAFLHETREAGLKPHILAVDPGDSAKTRQELRRWIHDTRPDVILCETAFVYWELVALGFSIPADFVCITLQEHVPDPAVAGFSVDYPAVIGHAVHLLDYQLRHNIRGIPARPIELLVPLVWNDGPSLRPPA